MVARVGSTWTVAGMGPTPREPLKLAGHVAASQWRSRDALGGACVGLARGDLHEAGRSYQRLRADARLTRDHDGDAGAWYDQRGLAFELQCYDLLQRTLSPRGWRVAGVPECAHATPDLRADPPGSMGTVLAEATHLTSPWIGEHPAATRGVARLRRRLEGALGREVGRARAAWLHVPPLPRKQDGGLVPPQPTKRGLVEALRHGLSRADEAAALRLVRRRAVMPATPVERIVHAGVWVPLPGVGGPVVEAGERAEIRRLAAGARPDGWRLWLRHPVGRAAWQVQLTEGRRRP